MVRDEWTRRSGAALGLTFILFGLIESAVAINGSNSIVFFWFPALCGGGPLVLLGVFRVLQPAALSLLLIIAGALAGALALLWTVAVLLLALGFVILAAMRPPLPRAAT